MIRRLGETTMTRRKEKALLALSIAALTAAAMASASETINYTYDARGRLVQVKHSGTVNNNVTANYTYDKANNRTNLNVASPNSPPP
jgi:YD repeat-containing protein